MFLKMVVFFWLRGETLHRLICGASLEVMSSLEGIMDAAVRELLEETGVVGKPLGVIDITDLFVKNRKGDLAMRYVIIDVLVEPVRIDLRPGSDALDAAFVHLDRVLEINLTPSTKKFFEKMLSRGICSIEPSRVWITEDIG